MQLGVSMTVRQTPAQVWEFLAFPPNAARWDRSVAEVIPQTAGPIGEGYEAITVSPGGMRQRFRITEFRPETTLRFVLVDSSMFTSAELSFLVDPAPGGTRITHLIDLKLRRRLLAPILRLTSRRALARDFTYLEKALADAY